MISVRLDTCGRSRFPRVSHAGKAVLALMVAALLLSGCQVIQSWFPFAPTQSVPLPATEVIPTAVENTATPTPANPEEARTLTVWLPPQFDPNSGTVAGDLLQNRLKTFARENGLILNIRIKSQSGPAGLLESLEITSVAAPHALPALIALPRSAMETAALKGLIYPLTDLTGALKQSNWYPYAAELAAVQGTPFCLPFAGDALVLLYRPTRLPVPAQDWQGILNTNQPLIIPVADPQALLTLELYRAAGGPLQDENGRPTLDPDILASVLQLYQRGAQLSTFPFWLSQFSNDVLAWQAYREQRADWIVTWASNYLSELPADTNLAALPAFTNPVNVADGWVWCLTDSLVDRRAISVKLAEYMVYSDFLANWTEAAGYLPTRPSSLAAWHNSSLSAPLQQILVNAHLRPENETVDNLGPVLQEAVLQVLQKQTDAVKAAQEAADRITIPNNP